MNIHQHAAFRQDSRVANFRTSLHALCEIAHLSNSADLTAMAQEGLAVFVRSYGMPKDLRMFRELCHRIEREQMTSEGRGDDKVIVCSLAGKFFELAGAYELAATQYGVGGDTP